MVTKNCGNCVGGLLDGAICPFCMGTTFITLATNQLIMDEQALPATDAAADTSVTVEAPAVEAQTTEAQTVEVAPEVVAEPVVDAPVEVAPEAPAEEAPQA